MNNSFHEITAKTVKLEIRDDKTGQIFTRELPIDYYENANCLRLQAENMDGSVSQLVFYSARGLDRLKDLTGHGPDHDDCGTYLEKR